MSQPSTDFRALVVDPSTHMAGLVTLMLHSLKIRAVDEAGDIPHARAFLDNRPYDLVLIDTHLGGEGNFALIRSVRQTEGHANRNTPIIMMAASPDAAMITAARDAGVTEFLRKPFSAHHIELRIEAIRNAPRDFVTAESYAGPDRRRRAAAGTPQRRASDPTKRSA
jgi:two-component system chemotaxis response regulator CheY